MGKAAEKNRTEVGRRIRTGLQRETEIDRETQLRPINQNQERQLKTKIDCGK
jgi:hypothetical protein